MTDGLVLIDKPAGITSHTVVARARRALGVRRIGHAGTLDPMATGVLVLGVGRATRLLGYLSADGKEYAATIRLGVATVTDDAEGDVVSSVDAAAVTDADISVALAAFRGDIEQVPSSVSAVKVDGRRSYARVRAGEEVALPPRPVRIDRLDVLDVRRPADAAGVVDVDVVVACSSGTYIRAIARDLGVALGVGGHLTVLRRTRSGEFGIAECAPLAEWESAPAVLPLAEAVARCFPRVDVDADAAARIGHGGSVPQVGAPTPTAAGDGPVGVFDPDGRVLALMGPADGALAPLVVFVG